MSASSRNRARVERPAGEVLRLVGLVAAKPKPQPAPSMVPNPAHEEARRTAEQQTRRAREEARRYGRDPDSVEAVPPVYEGPALVLSEAPGQSYGGWELVVYDVPAELLEYLAEHRVESVEADMGGIQLQRAERVLQLVLEGKRT